MAVNRRDIPQHYYSLEEYFALEAASDARFEWWDGEIVCMSGGTRAHNLVSDNVFFRLRDRLSGGPCRPMTANTPVKTPTLPPYRYPDVTVGCGDLEFARIQGVDALINPVLIVEVLSPSTAARDYNEKFVAYQAISAFREYLLIDQKTPRVTLYRRQSDGTWTREDIDGLDAILTLDSIGCQLSLREIHEDVKFVAA